MKTFEIFLKTGEKTRVTAAKVERRMPPNLPTQQGLVFFDEQGGVIAEFDGQHVAGIVHSPPKGTALIA